MKRFSFFLIAILLLFSCNQLADDPFANDPQTPYSQQQVFTYPDITVTPLDGREPMKGQEIYQQVLRTEGGLSEFKWDTADDYMLWSAIVSGDSTLSLGYYPEGSGAEIWDQLHEIDVNSPEWQQAKRYAIGFILQELNKEGDENTFTEEDLEIRSPRRLPILWLKLADYASIAKLRQLPTTWYIEPLGYDLDTYALQAAQRAGSGCGDGPGFSLSNQHYTSFSSTYSSSRVSWHLDANGVRDAWTHSQGDNVTVGIIDTGVDPDQDLLKSPEFTFGPSSSRWITKDYTYEGPYPWSNQNDGDDRCGHGTTIAGMIAGPVNNDGAITGIAYKANVYSMRVGNDVWMNVTREKNAFVEGLEDLADLSYIKIINIAMGKLSDNNDVKAAVNYAVGKSKLLICAAGSGGSGAIYPAKYYNTTGVTAVEYHPGTDPNGTNLVKAGSNSIGSHVDFSVFLRKVTSSGSKYWALGMRRDVPAPRIAIGSSAASAMISGICALVWAENPSLTKSQVLQILKESGSYYPSKNSNFGWGVVDAEAAVLAASNVGSTPVNVSISGPTFISSSGNYTWNSQVTNASGTKTYKWYWNGTLVSNNPNYSRYVSTDGVYNSDQLKLEVSTSSGQSNNSTIVIYNI